MTTRLPVLQPEAGLTRDQHRSRRARAVRAQSISIKRMTKRELELGRLLWPDDDHARPKTRLDCIDGERPCPFVSCVHNLYLDVSPRTGAIKLNFPDLEPSEMAESCALDVAAHGGVPLEVAGAIMNLTRERIRQLEVRAFAKMMRAERKLREVLQAYVELSAEPRGKAEEVL